MSNPTPRQRLRVRLESTPIIVAPGIYDAYGARFVEQAGLEAVYMTGNGVSASLLGRPDVGLIDLTLITNHAHRVASCVDIPLICDADTGYGNAVNVRRTVEEFESAGVAAIHLEDQVSPKRCGHLEGKEVISLAEMEKKLMAALESRTDPDFAIIGRTDARAIHGLEDAIKRGKSFAGLGVDAVFVEAPQSEAELETIARSITEVPLMVNMFKGGKTPLLPASRL